MRKERNLTEGDIKKQLVSLTWPMLLGMMGIVIFNLVDTYFVGQLGVHELAAMSFTFPVVMVLNSLSLGIGIGTSSLISRHIMKTEREEVKRMGSHALLLGFIVVTLVVVVGMLTIRPIFSAMGAKGDVLGFVEDYMSIWYLGVPFVLFPMIGNNILRATGDTFTPGMIMLASGIVNAILDPLFIFGYASFPEMGIRGAAVATVIARSVSFSIIAWVLIKKVPLVSRHFGGMQQLLSTWRSIAHIAGPATLTMLIVPVSVGVITKILAGFGKEAVAAFGVATRVEMFALMVVMALGSVLVIYAGQNLSKHKYRRIIDAVKYAGRFSMLWGGVVFVLLFFFGEFVAALFTDDVAVVAIAYKYFHIVALSYGFQGLVVMSTSTFNGLNRPYPSAAFSILRMVVLYLPLAWIGSHIFAITGVFWAAFIANVVAGTASFFYLQKTVRTLEGEWEM
ncbi:MATE family efflux transporter [bacterium]|nr:MATE family efflux transporter [bacterium]